MSAWPRRLWLGVHGALLALLFSACESDSPVERARAAEAAGDWRGALSAWQAAVDVADPAASPAAARLGLGQAQARTGAPAARDNLTRALEAAEAAGEAITALRARQQLARLALWQGRADEALVLVDRALAEVAPTWPPTLEVELRLTRAAALWRQGDLEAAEALWTSLRPRVEALGDDALIVRAAEGLAGAWRFRGRFAAAGALCDELLPRARRGPNAEERSRTLANCAGIRGAAGDSPGALALAGEAVAAADASGSARAQVHARNALAAQLIDARAADAALPVAEAAVERARAAGVQEYLDDALLYVALAQEHLGRFDAARETLRALAGVPEAASARTAEAHALQGRLALVVGDADAAIAAFGASVEGVEAMRAAVTPRQLHDFFDRDRRAPYLGLVELLARRGQAGDFDRALDVLGRLESRTFLEELRRSGGDATPTPTSAETTAGRTHLPADIAVLSWLPLTDAVLVFWATSAEIRVERVAVPGSTVEADALAFTASLRGPGGPDTAAAARVEAALLAPVARALAAWPEGAPVCVIPHGRLRVLPVEALPEAGRRLHAAHPVFTAPSLPALSTLLSRNPPPAPAGPLVVADAGGDLPGARGEAKRLAEHLAGARVLIGAEATEARVRGLMPGADPLHFAVHGYPPGPEQPGFLALAAAPGEDGRLTPAEVAALPLTGALVFLSACETSVGQPNATDELPDVLDRAFLHAGARAVVSTRWPINDAVAQAFSEVFHAERARLGALGAFHAAQRRLASGRGLDLAAGGPLRGFQRTAAPLGPPDARAARHWAAFVFHGNPR
jgi:CHAT domain-containing protein/tetratricopeptide (TPR) repeat protein